MQMAQPDKRIYPLYRVMIQQLFKPMATANDQLMHAAIGISGEVAELLDCRSMKNMREECGDIEFYIEALKQQFECDFINATSSNLPYSSDNISMSNVFVNLSVVSGDILDMCKKTWVYTKELDRGRLTFLIMLLEMNLEMLYNMFDLSREDIKYANQVKLIGPGGRFESGFYTDGAAIARADKVPNERKFIGQQTK